jgi:hypothetical protein
MDEQLKQRLMLAIVAFNLTMICYVIGAQLFGSSVGSWGGFFMRVLIGGGIGLVVGGLVFAAASVMKK